MNKFVWVFAWICSVAYVMSFITFIILTVLNVTDGVTAAIYIIISSIQLILIWALDNALMRVKLLEEVLEKQGLVNKRITDEVKLGYHEEPKENITYCPVCGYQLFPEDKICPNCKTPKKR